jgi:hypothetical protein
MRTNDEPFRKRVLSDCQAILMVWRINFRKAGANYSPLQQNHPDAPDLLSFKSSGEKPPYPLNHSPASTENS